MDLKDKVFWALVKLVILMATDLFVKDSNNFTMVTHNAMLELQEDVANFRASL